MNYRNELNNRIRGVQECLSEKNLDALTVSGEENLRYLFGVETGRGVVAQKSCVLWVRDLYTGVYSSLFDRAPYSVRVYGEGVIKKYFERMNLRRVGFEDLPYEQFISLRKKLGVKRACMSDILGQLRKIKSSYEISLVKKSSKIACAGMRKAYEVVCDGVPELYAAAEIEAEIRRLGSESPPFGGGMIIGSGFRGADIHARPSMKKIGRGLVVVDLGARYEGYHSDLTRTVGVGRLNKRERVLLEAVEGIKNEVVDGFYVGVKASDVYSLSNRKIRALGFEFYHALGHGVGLAIHEKPSLSPDSDENLSEGMVFTIEPGIYVARKYGIRFEDTVHLTRRGAKVLTGV